MNKLLKISTLLYILLILQSTTLFANTMGKKYVIAFPPNYPQLNTYLNLDIFVTSRESGSFSIVNKHYNINRKHLITKNKVTALTLKNGMTSAYWVANSPLAPEEKAFEITSNVPISVNVLTGKTFSTEGYTAIPVDSWGTHYIHNSYYDYSEANYSWRTNFVIVASEDNTEITVKLKGHSAGSPTGNPGLSIGDSTKIVLNKSQTYLFQGTGETAGLFDLSGTDIKSNKPIGLISSHERALIPYQVEEITQGRDNLLEMLPPVTAWGKEYFTVELDRGTDKGDYFRVVASEDNTQISIKWYDKNDKSKIDEKNIKLNANEFYEYNIDELNKSSIRGTSHFKANKPILVCQYSYSAGWDDTEVNTFDPFMINLSPVEQYSESFIFQTPSNDSDTEFQVNYINLFALGDSANSSKNEKLLNSVKIDSIPLTDFQPDFLNNRIPGSNVYWATIETDQSMHSVEANTKVGGYVYGFGEYNSYGWPISQEFLNLDTLLEDEECKLQFDYDNFSSFSDLTLKGIAKQNDSIIQLTNIENFKVGDIWYEDLIYKFQGFETNFSFKLSYGRNYKIIDGSLPGADGLAFVIQKNDSIHRGQAGGGIGYKGIKNSLAIEIDTYKNFNKEFNDPDGNHLAVFKNGTSNHLSDDMIITSSGIPTLYQDSIYHCKIIYSNNTMKIFMNKEGDDPILIVDINDLNLNSILELDHNTTVFIGITSATGNAVEQHDLLSWDLCIQKSLLSSVGEITEGSFSISPNPARNNINVSLDKNKNYLNDNIRIFNLKNELIIEQNLNGNYDFSIQLDELDAGVYFIMIGKEYRKFIKE